MTGVPWRRAILAVVAAVRRADRRRRRRCVPTAIRRSTPPPRARRVGSSTRPPAASCSPTGSPARRWRASTCPANGTGAEQSPRARAAWPCSIVRRPPCGRSTPPALRLGPPQSLSVDRRARRRRRCRPGGHRRLRPARRDAACCCRPMATRCRSNSATRPIPSAPASRPTGRCWRSPAGRCTGSPRPPTTCSATALPNAEFTLVGASPLVFDTDRRRVRLGDGDWVDSARTACRPARSCSSSPVPTPTAAGSAATTSCGASASTGSSRTSRSPGSASTAPTCCRSPATPARSCGARHRRSCASTGRRATILDDPQAADRRRRHAAVDVGIDRPDLDRRDGRQPRLGGPPVGHQRDPRRTRRPAC